MVDWNARVVLLQAFPVAGCRMSHVFELTDEQYAIIKEAAERSGRTPADLFLAWALEEETRYRQAHPSYNDTNQWLQHLGMSAQDIEASKERVRREREMPYDADA
ncbi:MAG TPA: hypothetical protein VFX24_01560 [Ktedonobacterales bacterium]|nr:hypothetical protein [Ktedonobacterales bacterium]